MFSPQAVVPFQVGEAVAVVAVCPEGLRTKEPAEGLASETPCSG